jgi:L-fuconolactonase
MKPQIEGNGTTDPGFEKWASDMARIARETGAFCKLSGLVTETQGDWSSIKLQPYVDHVLAEFGPERVMWGSDWPVCLLKAGYGDWHQAARDMCDGLAEHDRAEVFGGTAAQFYRIV